MCVCCMCLSILERPLVEYKEPRNPCVPSPCGPYSDCRVVGSRPTCSCLPSYLDRPPNCRPECVINTDCPMNKACLNSRCYDPCVGSCGANTDCTVVKHSPICQCKPKYTGDPFSSCYLVQESKSLYYLAIPIPLTHNSIIYIL